ncbi:MAG: outer membrane protein assembly factor BamB family protein [Pirellulales bacterium]
MFSRINALSVGCLVIGLMVASVDAQEWTRFRGPNGSGVSNDESIPAKFTSKDFSWKVKLPGLGHSSPVVWGNKLFLLSAVVENATRYVLCLDADSGKTLWKKEFGSTSHHLHTKNSFASCTPAVDKDRVYVAWSTDTETTLMALNHQGEILWDIDLGSWVSQHGFGTSPVLHDGKVYLSLMQLGDPAKLRDKRPGESRLVAIDQQTGNMVWQVPRESEVTSYAVPCIYKDETGRDLLICISTAHGIAAHDPKIGTEVWSTKLFSMRTVASPVIINGLIFGSTGSGGGGNYVVGIKPGKNPEVKIRLDRSAPYVPTPVANGKLGFFWYDKGIVTCIDTESGEKLWQKRVGGNFSGSPICVAGKLYCMSEEGDLVVLSATKNYEELNRISLGESSYSTPAVAGGKLYLRTFSHLICVEGK